MVEPFGEAIWQLLVLIGMYTQQDSVITFLVIYPRKENHVWVHKRTQIRMFVPALFVVNLDVLHWGMLNKMWYMHQEDALK